jgi:SAM-dependent methyltransferase
MTSTAQIVEARGHDYAEYRRACNAISGGEQTIAIEILNSLAEGNTQLWEVYNDLGVIANSCGNVSNAQAFLQKACSFRNAPDEVRINLALLQKFDKKYESALSTLSPLLRVRTHEPEILILVKEILGASLTLSAVGWARLVADLRTVSKEDITDPITFFPIPSTSIPDFKSELDEIGTEAENFRVHANIHEKDFLWQYLKQVSTTHVKDYFSGGKESADKIKKIVCDYFDCNKNISYLDFASGYGMVARHFKNVFPKNITYATCDIHPEANFFNAENLGKKAYQSSTLPQNLNFGEQFDVIFCLSFFSHISGDHFINWLSSLYGHVKEGGILAFTTHGRFSKQGPETKDDAIYFRPESEQKDLDTSLYGTSWVGSAYVIKAIKLIDPRGSDCVRVVRFSEAEWWGHQDLYVVAKLKR